jgi:hypothetical protein
VPIQILGFNVIVVVFPVPRPRIVGRVDIDGVDLAAMGIGQRLQYMEILTVDHRVERLVPAALHAPGADKAGVDVVAELGHHDQIGNRDLGRPRGVRVDQRQMCGLRSTPAGKPRHTPQPLITALARPAWAQDAHLVAPPHGAPGQFHALGPVPLEIQPEGATRRQRLELALQFVPQRAVPSLGARDQIRQTRHGRPQLRSPAAAPHP